MGLPKIGPRVMSTTTLRPKPQRKRLLKSKPRVKGRENTVVVTGTPLPIQLWTPLLLKKPRRRGLRGRRKRRKRRRQRRKQRRPPLLQQAMLQWRLMLMGERNQERRKRRRKRKKSRIQIKIHPCLFFPVHPTSPDTVTIKSQ